MKLEEYQNMVNEGSLKRFKVYVSGQSEPLILLGKNEKDVKHIAHQMIQNSSVRIRKVVKEGVLYEDYEDEDNTMPLVRSLNVLERELGKTKFKKVQEWGKKYHRSRKGLVKQIENLIRIARKMR